MGRKPTREEEIGRERRNCSRATDRDRESSVGVQVLPLLLSPLANTARNRPLPPDSDWRRSKSTVTDRFRMVTRQKQPQSMVPLGNELFAFRLACEPICTTRTRRYDSKHRTFDISI
ncbi:hypothetical protein BHM03_00054488 [Ensete ventricosum]|nr:hypothetical protein BHM03_00054488 [Ensete ventricosum]